MKFESFFKFFGYFVVALSGPDVVDVDECGVVEKFVVLGDV